MKNILSILAFIALFQSNTFAQLQTGENFAVTETTSGKVRGYAHNTIFTFTGGSLKLFNSTI